MTAGWTLEGELATLTGTDGIASALATLGIAEPDEQVVLDTVQDWYRSGAETYSLRFSASNGSRLSEFVLKACVAYGGQPLKDIFASWLSRRRLLDSLGVSTPRLYAAGAAVLVEEYVPLGLIDALTSGEYREAILRSIGRTVGTVVSAGFVPLSAHDWRSRGNDVVLIDFGQDLGPPGVGRGSEGGLLSEILDNVDRAGVGLSPTELAIVSASYESSLSDQ
ncbi:MAG: hypothetical protein ACRDSL_00955 [Pseudonocardiaceae bacterium]